MLVPGCMTFRAGNSSRECDETKRAVAEQTVVRKREINYYCRNVAET
jgi:hypothetical protein